MTEKSTARPTVLTVLPCAEDCASLCAILGQSNWDLRFTQTFEEARAALKRFSFKAVISENELSHVHCWKDLLGELQNLRDPPPLIVADRLADEHLWAEVLNLGGFDVIVKPFDAKEVLHVLTVACGVTERE